MQWVFENWVLLPIGGGMLAMHLFGHGHGHKRGHKGGGHRDHHGPSKKVEQPDQKIAGRSTEDTDA
ncbi:DUF2933 domain-containing protein (plasmid) [Pseudohalocynthiibacter aestuariivivens]|nr:DUF2933 domain-containing protein [Pseudohalocynthiibacter aestuariivivens]QIE47719.1 DUF2933 domain-containing protein [Pseudohalocynthiibacter aestuariivivens]